VGKRLIGAFGSQLSAIGQRNLEATKMQDFRNLDVWQKAHTLTISIYTVTKTFPDDERFGLVSQLRRSCASIGANLAEGCGRGTDADFSRHVQISMGSACEAEYHLLLAKDLHYLPDEKHLALQEEISRIKRMLTSLLKSLR
jgi:four helix bundle protein